MDRRAFLRGSVNALSVMAIATVLKGRTPEFIGVDLACGPDVTGFGLASPRPEGGVKYDWRLVDQGNGLYKYTGKTPGLTIYDVAAEFI